MRVFFFNRVFYPNSSATSQILSDLALRLAKDGYRVHVVTSADSKTDSLHPAIETHFVSPPSIRTDLFGRAFAYIRYWLAARRAAEKLLESGDTVVVMTDPPLLLWAVAPVVTRRGARLIAWLQDIFPEIAERYGVPGLKGPVSRSLKRARDRSLQLCAHIVAISDDMAAFIAALPLRNSPAVSVIHNWADGDAITPIAAAENPIRRRWGVDAQFVVGYSGNLGRVHEFETLLEAARLLRGESGIRFVIAGAGPRLNETRDEAARRGLDNILFVPPQHRADLRYSLGAADVHLCILVPKFEGLVHPSKLYGIMAAGRPTITIGDVEGDAARIVGRYRAGLSVRHGDADLLASAIRSLRDDSLTRLSMGRAARAAFDSDFSMDVAVQRWKNLLGHP